MNKQEAKQKLHNIAFAKMNARPDDLKLADVMQVIDQIDEPEKPVVPQVAIDFYEKYKDEFLPVFEWFDNLYDDKFLYKFQDRDKLLSWLDATDNKTSLQRELALVTLIVNGVEAVQVEKQKLYTVEIPDPHGSCKYRYLYKNSKGVTLGLSDGDFWKTRSECQLTESEIRKDFEWAWQWAKPVEEEE